MNKLTLGSLFDGSGGFSLAGLMADIQPVWASEIEPFCIRVTSKRLPQMKHYGDITKLKGDLVEPVDIITFGSPCQDLSLAGKRNGLDGSKSSLFYEAIRVIKEMRDATNGQYPRWIAWENVPGALSSCKGQDFRTVINEICKVKDKTISVPMPEKKWTRAGEVVGIDFSLAWRILDAQYFGVPQRRRRIFLVADFGGKTAGKILFESEGVFGDFKAKRNAWQGTAHKTQESIDETGGIVLNDQGGQRMDVTENITSTLRARANHPPCVIQNTNQEVYENHSQDSRYTGPLNVAQTVLATYGTGGNNQPFVVREEQKTLKIRSGCDGDGKAPIIQDNKSATLGCNNDQTLFVPSEDTISVAYGICSDGSNAMKSDNPKSGIYKADTSRTIDGNGINPSSNQGGLAIVESYAVQGSMIGRKNDNGPNGSGVKKDISFTLNTVDKHCVYAIDRAAYNQGKNAKFNISIRDDEKAQTVVAQGPGAVYTTSKASYHTEAEKDIANTLVATDYKDPPTVTYPQYAVRRLTPLECCRLQGFPDYWCEGLETENPSDYEINEWSKIFETYRFALGKSKKPKTRNQIIKWLKNPCSDSVMYMMWGNGIALPCSYYVLNGIKHYSSQKQEQ